MAISEDSDSIGRLIRAIEQLPSDKPVADRQQGYNRYNTQKEHWLGWLGKNPGRGTYERRTGKNRGGQYVYNHINEPNMLLWLVAAAGVKPVLIEAAKQAASKVDTLPGKSASIRKHVPWSEVATALWP